VKGFSPFFIYLAHIQFMRKLFLFVFLISVMGSRAQNSATSAEIYQSLKKLDVLGSVLYVAAHPDDENTRLLAYFAKEKLYRTGYLSLTRGDGGQNLIGDEQGVDLGLIRTQELLSARKIDGAEQFFSRAFDFGYSKSPDETLEKWNRDKILSDVVWVIRKFQPDVIITRFPTTGEGGHGHHTASAILANEAFFAAADAAKFPEQLKYVKPWQAKRILWNYFNFNNNQTYSDAVSMDVGAYNQLLGKSYGEIASESRSQHKSQGFGVARNRGVAMEYFKATGGTMPEKDLFEDVITDWKKVKGSEQVQLMISEAIAKFDFISPYKSVPQLLKIRKALTAMPAGYWQQQKLKEVEQLVEQASGLWVEAFTSQPKVAQGDTLRINFSVNNRKNLDVVLKSFSMQGVDTLVNKNLPANLNQNYVQTIRVPANYPLSQPYWLENPMETGSFNVDDKEKIGQPDADPSFTVNFLFNIEGEELLVQKAIKYKYTDPVRGELYQPLTVIPPFTIETSRQANLILPKQKASETFSYVTHRSINELGIFDAKDTIIQRRSLAKGARETVENTFINEKSFSPGSMAYTFQRAYFSSKGEQAKSIKEIQYDHIPHISYFTDAAQQFVLMDLKTSGKKIGYISGAGDKVPEALTQMGYEVTIMGEKELSKNHLAQFDAIITGVRAYNTNEWLNNFHVKLMEYVKNGGNLIVQYNTSNQIGPVRAKIGPYPFNIGRNRVSVETAPVQILDRSHSVFNFPNKISDKDFEGWIQERSIYHASEFDSSFKPLLRMNDPGEKADDGSLIVAKYGKGYFTYTGLVFFRELPAGIPGAYRIMANLIGLNRKEF
jgi:LmbE family N-acetylglucosaminyl deacetylase